MNYINNLFGNADYVGIELEPAKNKTNMVSNEIQQH